MSCPCCGGVAGCTDPKAVNYNASATCDDGSCLTCCTQNLCRLSDDCKGDDCNSATGTEFQNCCDSGCLPCECPDRPNYNCNFNDCHTSFAGANFTASRCNGTTIVYYNCYSCPTATVVSGGP